MSCSNDLKCSCFPPYFPFRPVFCRMGILACYLEPQDLGSYLQDAALSAALLPQLARCTSEGFISESGRVSRTLSNTSVNQHVPPFVCCCSALCFSDSCTLGWHQLLRTSAPWSLCICLPSADSCLSWGRLSCFRSHRSYSSNFCLSQEYTDIHQHRSAGSFSSQAFPTVKRRRLLSYNL